jgi:Ras-related protein Rab-5C
MKSAQVTSRRAQRSEKVVLIGAASSGKTSILGRFSQSRFVANTESTVGAAFVPKLIAVGEVELRLEIWDTGGTEKYKSLAPMYYRDARAAILVFDVTNDQSFRDASSWLSDFRERGHPTAICAGAANKIDLAEQKVVSKSDCDALAEECGLNFIMETSALDGTNVNKLFNELAKRLLQASPVTGTGVVIAAKGKERNPCKC